MIDNPWQNRYSTMRTYLKRLADSELQSVINFVGLHEVCKERSKRFIIDKVAWWVVDNFEYKKYIILKEYKLENKDLTCP